MKTCSFLLILIHFFALSNNSYGLSLGEVIFNDKERIFRASSAIEFESVKKTETNGASGYNFERFLINQIQIRKGRSARIFYSKKDIMPPCIFTHVPSFPPTDKIFQIKSLVLLSVTFGQAHEIKEGALYWSVFKISENSVHLMHIRVLRGEGDQINSMSIFESSKEYSKLIFDQ